MDKITGSEVQKARYLYDAYECNQAVIFSIFENQYDGCIYTNDRNDLKWSVLQTPFLQHFIAGVPTDGCAPILEEILFTNIPGEQNEKEIVVFSDTDKWNDILQEIFKKHNGVSDSRKLFAFSADNYCKCNRLTIPGDVQAIVEKCKTAPNSHIDTWSAKLFVKGQAVSHCDAMMIGKGMAEIDIATDEAFRGNGYATMAAILLIDKLLEDGLVPSWSTWPYRVESQHIARKLGFIPQPDAKAWIWVEGM